MDIGQLFQTVIGTLVGGSIVIATNWINAQQERKKAAQQWYEETYITKGVDPLITYFTGLELHFLLSDNVFKSMNTDLNIIPVDALTKIQTLLDSPVLTKIIGLVQTIPAKDGTEAVLLVAVTNVGGELLSFRKGLLKDISTKVSNKNYVIDASDTRDKLTIILDGLYSFAKGR